MYFYVKYIDIEEFKKIENEKLEASDIQNKTLLVNPKCPIGLIRDYISDKLHLPEKTSFGLCTDKTVMIKLSQFQPTIDGLDILKEKETYYVVLTDTADEQPSWPIVPILSKFSKEYIDFMALQKRKSTSSAKIRRSSSIKSNSKDTVSISSSGKVRSNVTDTTTT
ncbi:uncharacterized protein LOC115886050 [Sitophilus oryzae]|uniref:Uncharacterized protein LOC115886050 n=1 Tax=Sitophilus oryzae TaxID=7048 RepID=A0A6J2YBV1_SITOR|nr:uncharacterized protein LOC115886050 [Sitophilus oryzae]